MYERPFDFNEFAHLAAGMPMLEDAPRVIYDCEAPHCEAEATTEWRLEDDDNSGYTMRCDTHAVEDEDYIAYSLDGTPLEDAE